MLTVVRQARGRRDDSSWREERLNSGLGIVEGGGRVEMLRLERLSGVEYSSVCKGGVPSKESRV